MPRRTLPDRSLVQTFVTGPVRTLTGGKPPAYPTGRLPRRLVTGSFRTMLLLIAWGLASGTWTPGEMLPGALTFGPMKSGTARLGVNRQVTWTSVSYSANAMGQEITALDLAMALEKQLVSAIARSESSVVAIARVRKTGDRAALEPSGLDEAFPGTPPSATDPNFIPNEYATGVVIDPQGLILTTYHSLGDPNENDYYVWHSRVPYKAIRVQHAAAADPWMDLAVLKIDAEDLPTMAFGDASSLKKGQIVIALGNPFAIARDGQVSASWGIVANLGRKAAPQGDDQDPMGSRETLHHFGSLIQTDAKLNQGTSGGALLNLRGEMVGLITSLTAGPTFESAAGFAIPVDDDLKRTVEVLKSGRRADFGFLGVLPTPLTLEERQRGGRGARVRDVWGATPAAEAGLRAGDLLLAVNNQPIYDDNDVIRHVAAKLAGSQVDITIQRNNELLTKRVTLSKKPLQSVRAPFASEPDPKWRGLRVEYLTAMSGFQQFGRLFDLRGTIGVLDVERNSPSWNAGLRPGDFISHVGRRAVSTPSQFHAAVAPLSGEVTLTLLRSGRTQEFAVAEEAGTPEDPDED
jgi:serine protease Do